MKMNEQVLSVALDLKECMFPAKPTTANLAAYLTLSVNMIIMDCARAFSPDLSLEKHHSQLTSFVKDFGIGMNTDINAKQALGKDEMQVRYNSTYTLFDDFGDQTDNFENTDDLWAMQ